MLKKLLFLLLVFIPNIVKADDCLAYKLTPKITITIPYWQKDVIQPLQSMDTTHGNVIATFVDNYEITTDITSIEDGFCVSLKSIDATMGYTDFIVRIDKSYKPNTCSYNTILSHEDMHINAYLSIIEDNKNLFNESLQYAANSITPIFIKTIEEAESATDKLNEQLQKHPEIVLLKQNIKAQEEIRNKYVDEKYNGELLKKCSD